MSQRKQYIIDKKYQLKTTFSIIGSVAIIIALIVVIIGFNIVLNNKTMNNNNKNINTNNENIRNINEIQDNIVHFLSSRNLKSEDKIYKQAIREVAQNHVTNMKKLKSILKSNEDIMKSNKDIMVLNNYLLIAIIIVIIAGTIILYIQLIRKTHHVSGPIYVMSTYIKEILNGNYPEMRKLRDKDELKDFYELFKQLVEKTKGK